MEGPGKKMEGHSFVGRRIRPEKLTEGKKSLGSTSSEEKKGIQP